MLAANVLDLKSDKGTVSNTYGFFSLSLENQDSAHLVFSYIGYQPNVIKIALKDDVVLNIDLSSSLDLNTVEVTASKVEKIEERTQMSTIDIPIEQIKKIPCSSW